MLKQITRALLSRPVTIDGPAAGDAALKELAGKVDALAQKRLGRSLAIRAIDAGSCNGCELEIHALNNPIYDLERFGIRFVASPRHADVLLVTGPVSLNMQEALLRTIAATPAPRFVVAAGDCACTGGLFAGSYACAGALESIVPVDLRIAGCPPTPLQLLEGLLALLAASAGKMPARP
ncbi:NADH-quinone oxidoreductase subunit B family protein [Vineibacter terrae]|uniref:NADH-quinone oxidoreductase subunit NuoB n=1 Tax=Vineibacter terrae TaxID=2586908 RepID=A0A5C8PAA1_9HYPH|nr:NADH-quinone oxidoreductase subunit NuoB [Vineibacter terrae]TXL70475.1 NADH-quinone oxidoreductase subunit NuoB [Vineibacter terrae]HEX2889224.1 NADH-quinone oxidoreductase subunit NuoB [Vineibacter terrae]